MSQVVNVNDRVREQARRQTRDLNGFDYGAPAELFPNRGARVRQLSERDLAELFDVMGGLEALAGRLADVLDGCLA